MKRISQLLSMLFGSGNDVDSKDAAAAIKAGSQVVDVREPSEFSSAAIPGSINVPLGIIQREGLEALRRAGVDVNAASIILVCRSGARSGGACSALRSSLGDRAHNLAGGIMAWGSNGLTLTPGGRSTSS